MERAVFFRRLGIGAAGIATLKGTDALAGPDNSGDQDLFYVGCYTSSPDEGIRTGLFHSDIPSITPGVPNPATENPSFLILSRSGEFVYAVNETDNFGGRNSGAVTAFRSDPLSGKLTRLNSVPSMGAHPCHLTTDRTGCFVLVANYTGGNASVLPVLPNGSLGEAVSVVQHSGSGPNAARQEKAHAHSVNLSPDNRFAFVCDLGTDKVMIYRFDEQSGKLTPAPTPFFQTEPGAGPRHFAFTRDGRRAFVVNELNSTLTWLNYRSESGKLMEIDTMSTLPEGFTGENTCADVHVHPEANFVYVSNRGHDSIALFSFDPETGVMELIRHHSCGGKTPRNFAIHRSGRFMMVANQNSGTINLFTINPENGHLAETGKQLAIPKPVCIQFKLP